MNTVQVDCFLQAAKERSFSQAAQKLYMSQPTFGRQIAALERELGVPLFTRGASSTTLTEEGQILYKGLSAMKEQYTQLVAEAQRLYHGHGGHFSFGLLDGQLLDEKTSALLQQFRQKYPAIQFSVSHYSFRAMADALMNRELDIGLTLTKDVAERSELDYRELYALSTELVVHKSHPLAHGKELTLADFSGDTFIEVENSESGIVSSLMRESIGAAGFSPKFQFVPDLKTQLFCLESGSGVAASNPYNEVYNHPSLAHIPLPELSDVSFCAAFCREITNPAARLFLELWSWWRIKMNHSREALPTSAAPFSRSADNRGANTNRGLRYASSILRLFEASASGAITDFRSLSGTILL